MQSPVGTVTVTGFKIKQHTVAAVTYSAQTSIQVHLNCGPSCTWKSENFEKCFTGRMERKTLHKTI